MSEQFTQVKEYIGSLGLEVVKEDAAEELVVINDEDRGINHMIVDCEDSLLVIEQHIFQVKNESLEIFKDLLVMNRTMVHGAFVLDQDGKNVLYRDTLQLANLDLNELEASINSLGLALAENSNRLIEMAN